MQEMYKTRVWSLGQEDRLEEEIATHSSILAWRILWSDEPGRLVHRVTHRHDWSNLACTHTHINDNIWYLSFSIWLTSLTVTISRSIHVAANRTIPFFFYGWVIFHCIYIQNVNKNVKSFSRVQLFATPWTVAYQAPPSMGFSRQ